MSLIQSMLMQLVEKQASDLIMTVGRRPQIRLDGELISAYDDVLDKPKLQLMIQEVLSKKHLDEFDKNRQCDFSFGIGPSRFRGNAFYQMGNPALVFRRIPLQIPSFEQLGLPTILEEIALKERGLTLVTGATGSGKSTSLAAMIDKVNMTQSAHIITLEDPIEYIHQHKKSTVEQREVGNDVYSFDDGLRSILRQDPDVVLLGEMRDPESIQAALTIAETGHHCFASLHTNGCAQTLNRIVDVFPSDKRQQILAQVSLTLNCVVSQVLLPKIGGGLVVAMEIMIANPAIRALIREAKFHSIPNQIQTGAQFGMRTMNQDLLRLLRGGLIREVDAISASPDPDELRKELYS